MITPGNLQGSELRKLRKEAGLRQDQLASLISVTPKTVHCWETGKNRISAAVQIGLWMILQDEIAERQRND